MTGGGPSMSKKQENTQATDEHGLVIHQYVSTVLVVVPPAGFGETTMRYARSALFNVHVGTRVVSSEVGAVLRGELQDEFEVDGSVTQERMEPYSGLLLCGGSGAGWLGGSSDVVRLVREADEQEKLIGAWGGAVEVLAKAGILRRRRLTGDRAAAAAITAAGGRYTGTQVEVDGRLVTALDDAAGFRFGKALVQIVGI